jgi:hypothetical protein
MLNVTDSVELVYENRNIQTVFDRNQIHTPSYISSLNCDGSAFLVQHCSQGSCLFSANEDMTEKFISTKEANSIYMSADGDPDSVAKRLIASRDRSAYMKAVCSLMVNHPTMNSETVLLLHCNLRNSDSDAILCLCQIRVSMSVDGKDVCMGTKFTPMPTTSEYITVKPMASSLRMSPPPFHMSSRDQSNSTSPSPSMSSSSSHASSFPRLKRGFDEEQSEYSETEEDEPLSPTAFLDEALNDNASQSHSHQFVPASVGTTHSWEDVHPPEFLEMCTFSEFEPFGVDIWDMATVPPPPSLPVPPPDATPTTTTTTTREHTLKRKASFSTLASAGIAPELTCTTTLSDNCAQPGAVVVAPSFNPSTSAFAPPSTIGTAMISLKKFDHLSSFDAICYEVNPFELPDPKFRSGSELEAFLASLAPLSNLKGVVSENGTVAK